MKNAKQFNNNLFISQLTINKPVEPIQSQQKLPQKTANNQDKPKVIIGNYLLGKQIGSGSFGKVHLGLHLPTNQKIAIKIIKKQNIRLKDIPRIKNQISILSTIRHRHIIHLYQIIETKSNILMVTEYMPNGQLFNHILNSKKLAQEEACIYFQQIISAVQYLHQMGIAHRDIKPENILIDYDNQLKLIDFGLSTQYQKNQHLKSFCGSPCYAAPQVLLAKKSYSPLEADIWSCGVILYTMLCGYLPFCDENTYTLHKKIVQCNFKLPNSLSGSSRNLLSNILTLNPKKRYTINQIKQHEWFTKIALKPTFGLFKDHYLPHNKQLLKQLTTSMNLQQQKLLQSLSTNKQDKYTSAYYILMKKKIKSSQKLQHYIGNDYFNSKLIIFKQQKIELMIQTADVLKPQIIQDSQNVLKPIIQDIQNVPKPEIMYDNEIVVSNGMVNLSGVSSKPDQLNNHYQIDKHQETKPQNPEHSHPTTTSTKQTKKTTKQNITTSLIIAQSLTQEQSSNNLLLDAIKPTQQYKQVTNYPNLSEEQKDIKYQQKLSFYSNNYHLLKKRLNLQQNIFSISEKIIYDRYHQPVKHTSKSKQTVKTPKTNSKEMLWINYIYKKQFRNTLNRETSRSTIKTKINMKSIEIQRFLPTINNRSFISKKSDKQTNMKNTIKR